MRWFTLLESGHSQLYCSHRPGLHSAARAPSFSHLVLPLHWLCSQGLGRCSTKFTLLQLACWWDEVVILRAPWQNCRECPELPGRAACPFNNCHCGLTNAALLLAPGHLHGVAEGASPLRGAVRAAEEGQLSTAESVSAGDGCQRPGFLPPDFHFSAVLQCCFLKVEVV